MTRLGGQLRENIFCKVCARKTSHKLRHSYTESYKVQKSPDGVVVFFILDIALAFIIAVKQMTPSQLKKAQDLARECVRKKYKGC